MKNQNTTKIGSIALQEIGLMCENKATLQDNADGNTHFKFLGGFRSKLRKLMSQIKEKSTVLYWVSLFILSLGVVCILGIVIDDRTLLGVNVWIKPLKFSISITIYLLTVGYLITKYPYSTRKKNSINHITAWSMLLEFAIIMIQGARGVQSHYNVGSALDGILFMFMGVFVGINVIIMVLFIFDTIRLKLKTTKAMQWSILLGWTIVLFGSWVGGQMISQVAHNVGVADGGAGLPLVNWSTKGGDLRVAHFFSLHAIQIIPLFALWVSRKSNFSTKNQIIAVTVFALFFASWIAYIFYQAKQGIPMIAL